MDSSTREIASHALRKLGLYPAAKAFYDSPAGLGARRVYRRAKRVLPFIKPAMGPVYARFRTTAAVQDNLILYESFHGNSVSCHPLAIYKWLNSRDEWRHLVHVWVVQPSGPIPGEIVRDNTRVVERDSADYAQALASARFLVNNSTFPSYFATRPEQRYLNTWHGVPLKKMFMDEGGRPTVHANSARNFLQATHIALPNSFTAERLFSSAGVNGILPAHVVENCSPRHYLTRTARPSEIKRRWGLAQEQRVVLYAPTWRGQLGEATDNSQLIDTALNAIAQSLPDAAILLSIHNMDILSESRASNVRVLAADDEINEVMACVDILISDYSSIIFDFFPLGRPVILFTPDLEQYRRNRGFYLEPSQLPVTLAGDGAGLAQALQAAASPGWQRPPAPVDPAHPCWHDGSAESLEQMLGDFIGGPIGELCSPYLNNKANVVMFAGGLKPNGISTSAINLSHNFDHENYNLILMSPGSEIDDDKEKQQTLAKLDPRCFVVHKYGPVGATDDERDALERFYSRNSLAGIDSAALKALFTRETARLLGRIKIDVAIDFSGYARYWSLLLGLADARRRVIYQHNDMLSEAESRFRILYGVFESYGFYDRIVSVSAPTMEVNKTSLLPLYPAYRDKFDFVHNSIVPEQILSAAQQPLERLGEFEPAASEATLAGYSFVTMGRLSPEKDQEKLIYAFAELAKQQPQIHLFIIGTGPLLDKLQKLRAKLGLAHRITFTGQLANPFPLLARCDAFVLSSNYEGQPMVLLEALTLGKAVVATDIPGSRSVLGRDYGLLVANTRAGLVEGMARALRGEAQSGAFDPCAYAERTRRAFNARVLGEPRSGD